jgi:hypothetical protein
LQTVWSGESAEREVKRLRARIQKLNLEGAIDGCGDKTAAIMRHGFVLLRDSARYNASEEPESCAVAIRTEACRRTYWTMVSVNTYVSIDAGRQQTDTKVLWTSVR